MAEEITSDLEDSSVGTYQTNGKGKKNEVATEHCT